MEADIEILYLILSILAYFAPSIIAIFRKHRSYLAIIAVNTLLAWTVFGWLWAFLWSLTGNVAEKNPKQEHKPS
ncbi:superinfection immunity protein [Halorhodospira halochloris]|uniref:Superinfection immunity protein n=1 Tax=Halorhodospira halochloris TaxID=1052 RepID=A0A110B534_HALHR|nr:superinfection immunity protein [Halorhodospira halochloris]MBK1652296.1 hypothetical protein [Halorhodospira halochloris]MCG5529715.1 superinfection immunity protein [Halorhodospira halochloris]MCG5548369.1 superinfection immunity protein [Halorhodospira halochloris]BAU56907.1 hypothetical protein HH1059_02310 [Halorhodospira halochloris]